MRAAVLRRWVPARPAAVAAILAIAVASGAAQKQAPPAPGPAKDFVIPSPKQFTLSNGLPVTMVPFGLVPKVTIRLVVEAANVHEQKEQVWLADLTGNMMREGTTALSADAIAREFAAMGGQLAVNVGPDAANVVTDVLADHGVKAVQLIADVAQRPRLPESELTRVKSNMVRDLAIQRSTPQ
jgi:zinc protease